MHRAVPVRAEGAKTAFYTLSELRERRVRPRMSRVIRAVRIPEHREDIEFELHLPRGAQLLKACGVFAGMVDADGQPVLSPALFLLADPHEIETEPRRFQTASLTSGLDDLTSEVPFLSGAAHRYISDMPDGLMLFELLDEAPEITVDSLGVHVVRI